MDKTSETGSETNAELWVDELVSGDAATTSETTVSYAQVASSGGEGGKDEAGSKPATVTVENNIQF